MNIRRYFIGSISIDGPIQKLQLQTRQDKRDVNTFSFYANWILSELSQEGLDASFEKTGTIPPWFLAG